MLKGTNFSLDGLCCGSYCDSYLFDLGFQESAPLLTLENSHPTQNGLVDAMYYLSAASSSGRLELLADLLLRMSALSKVVTGVQRKSYKQVKE